MDINLLPLEMLQEIMSYLSYDELKVASLVCHRWNQSSGTLIVRNGQLQIFEDTMKDLEVVRNSTRNYQSIHIFRMKKWKKLQAAVLLCSQRFPNVRRLYLAGVLQDYLDRFYQAFRDWMERLESLAVSLDDRYQDLFLCGPEDFVLRLPKLKELHWAECLYGNGQKTVTIDAPELEYVCIDDSLDASAVLKILHCGRIRYIRCIFYTKHFEDTFSGNFDNVETLILHIVHSKCDISCLSKMPQLRYLSLTFSNALNYLPKLEAMPKSKLLKVLSVTIQSSTSGTLNLNNVVRKFDQLKTLDLCGINIEADDEIQAEQLVFLKVRESACFCGNVSIKAPKLEILTMAVDMLGKLQLNESKHLSELYVNLTGSAFRNSFEQIICPFLQQHKKIKHLVMIRDRRHEDQAQAVTGCDRVVENIECLELHMIDVSIDFFRLLSGWKSLKTIKLRSCTLDCSEMRSGVVRLPGVERLTLDCVHLKGTGRTDFPIVWANDDDSEEIFYKWSASKLSFSSRKSTYKQHKFLPFSRPEIEPMFARLD